MEASKLIKIWLRDKVEDSGNIYFSAGSVEEGFSMLENHSIDIIVTAMEFEAFEGAEFLKQLNDSKFQDIPTIVLTSTDTLEMRQEIYNLGVVDYLVKGQVDDHLIKAYFRSFNDMKLRHQELLVSKIAVLDDSVMSIRVIEKIFSLAGVKDVTYYSDPRLFLEDDGSYDVYLIDLVLPESSGEEILHRIKALNPDSSVIIMSTVSNYKTISSVLMTGADDYLMKPFDANIFLARLTIQMKYRVAMKSLEEKNQRLQLMTQIDELTQVYNRRYIMSVMDQELITAKWQPGSLGLLILDIDDFKTVNDSHGHIIGDEVLRQVANQLSLLTRSQDTLARYGGEEFLIFMKEVDHLNEQGYFEKILNDIQALDFGIPGLKVTLSGGYRRIQDENIDQAIHLADEKLYKAKRDGKNRIYL